MARFLLYHIGCMLLYFLSSYIACFLKKKGLENISLLVSIPVMIAQLYLFIDLFVEFYKDGDFVCDQNFKKETRHVEPLVITFVVFGYFYLIIIGFLFLLLCCYCICCGILLKTIKGAFNKDSDNVENRQQNVEYEFGKAEGTVEQIEAPKVQDDDQILDEEMQRMQASPAAKPEDISELL